jgi:hypothetical protein
MNIIRKLTFAAAVNLALGTGAAMAQDSAFFTEQAEQAPHASSTYRPTVPMIAQPDAGSSDVNQGRGFIQQLPLYGADGSGG